MRLTRIASALATAIVLLNTVPMPASASGIELDILAPGDGGELRQDGTVVLGFREPPGVVAGTVSLNGTRVATFARDLGNGSILEVRIDANASPTGPALLVVEAWDGSGASSVASREVWLTTPNLAPDLEVFGVSFEPDPRRVVVEAHAVDPDGEVVQMTLATPWGRFEAENTTHVRWVVPVVGPSGNFTVVVGARDDRGDETTTSELVVVPDLPPSVTILRAEHEIGFGFVIEVLAVDPEGERVHVTAAGPGGAAIQENGTDVTTLRLPAFPPRGLVNVTLLVKDGTTRPVTVQVPIEVVGRHVVVYDRVVRTTLGAHAEMDLATAGPRIRDGQITICTTPACEARSLTASVLVLHSTIGAATTTQACGAPLASVGRDCSFTVAPGTSRSFTISYALAAATTSVRIEGWEV